MNIQTFYLIWVNAIDEPQNMQMLLAACHELVGDYNKLP